ncbi:hypothetical protein ROZALSC1DRAFT_23369 [Rozella allomycis CSF55]|uniref:Uncharacterized protein n=1 Tax=Rozella allomycis (strain CSF55) TaxID=988480 RepID=A0A4P9YFT2_ROZAC|nr:hypothetical protein ROZALSC1DRAFT_23369 [Rozella allomycis CSF55]
MWKRWNLKRIDNVKSVNFKNKSSNRNEVRLNGNSKLLTTSSESIVNAPSNRNNTHSLIRNKSLSRDLNLEFHNKAIHFNNHSLLKRFLIIWITNFQNTNFDQIRKKVPLHSFIKRYSLMLGEKVILNGNIYTLGSFIALKSNALNLFFIEIEMGNYEKF